MAQKREEAKAGDKDSSVEEKESLAEEEATPSEEGATPSEEKDARTEEKELERKIFISHRHEDKEIATALRKQLKAWRVPSSWIFQSSEQEHGGRIGKQIKEEIQDFLDEAKLVILIYTFSDQNWEYCMWECGLATDAHTAATKIVVFKCTEDTPRVFQDELLVGVDREGVARFTAQFHRDPTFFPGMPPYDPDIPREGLDTRSKALFEALGPAIPKRKLKREVRWGYFTLGIPSAFVKKVAVADGIGEGEALCRELQDQICLKSTRGWGIRHFGFDKYDEGLNLAKLFHRWEEGALSEMKVKQLKASHVKWMEEFRAEICRTVRKDNPRLTWEPFKSNYPDIDWWVCPVINEARYLPDGGIDVDVYMYRVLPPRTGVSSK